MKVYHIAIPLLGSATLEADRPCPWMKPELEPSTGNGERVINCGRIVLYLSTWASYRDQPRV